MVEQAIDQKGMNETFSQNLVEGDALSIGGTLFSTVGKIALAVGTTGILLYLFFIAEAFIGLGVIYTGATVIAAGLASMSLGNRLANGYWFEGLLSA